MTRPDPMPKLYASMTELYSGRFAAMPEELRFGIAKAKPEGGRVAYDVRRARKIRANRRRR